MSVKIDKIHIGKGDSVFLSPESSAERSLAARVDSNGRFIIMGPMNDTMKTYEVTTRGIVEYIEGN